MTNNEPMMTYSIGRFSIAVPPSMKRAARTASLRFTELREVPWLKEPGTDQQRDANWKSRLFEIAQLKPPRGKDQLIIEQQDIPLGKNTSGVLYFGDQYSSKTMFWEMLVDVGGIGLWLKQDGTDTKLMKENGRDIARAYKVIDPTAPLPKENGFYLEHGYIALPYLEQEETYARFEGHPLELKLEFKTTVVHKVSESGLVDRLAASLAMSFAPGVDIDKLRTGKRSVAGIAGEEVILRGTQDGNSELNFIWLFTGKADSGDAPKISIEMEAPDGRVEDKLKVWDAILNSIKPIGR